MELDKKITELEEQLQHATNGFAPIKGFELSSKQVFCPDHGEYTQYERKRTDPMWNGGGLNWVIHHKSVCPECLKIQLAEAKQDKLDAGNAKRTQRIAELKVASGVGERFKNATFANYETTSDNSRAKAIAQRYADKWLERSHVGGGLIFCGKTGTGKTHLACAIANAIIENHQADVLVTTMFEIATLAKSCQMGREQMTTLSRFVKPELLIIDELGVQYGTDFEQMTLFQVINGRYMEKKSTIIISNLPENALSRYATEPVLDRMREGKGCIVNFDWNSYRK